MTFGEYTETLFGTGLFGENRVKAGADLFKATGPYVGVSNETVKSWMKGTRNSKAGKYFPNNSVDEEQLIRVC